MAKPCVILTQRKLEMINSSSLESLSLSFSSRTSNSTYILNSLDFNHPHIQSERLQQLIKKTNHVPVSSDSFMAPKTCFCGRRHFIEASAAILLPASRSVASESQLDPKDMLNRVHPARPDWYEEFYAVAMEKSMKPYEDEIADYKSNLFTKLHGKSKVLELGIGTGPNLKYYAGLPDVSVFGIDPNRSMEKYAQAAAAAAGLPSTRFSFTVAVGEALPIPNGSMDTVVGTLVLCSVRDIKLALQEVKRVLKPGGLYIFIEHVAAKDGTTLRLVQNVFDPLQQLVSDGCHLTRETGKYISQAGFSRIDMNMAYLSNASLISPHVYGIAFK